MKKFLFLIMAVATFAMAPKAGAQEYLWFGEEVHEVYYEDYDFIENGIYYHILDTDTPEVAVMNHRTIIVHVGAWVGETPDAVLYEWTDGDYSGDLVIPENVEHEGVKYEVTRISYGAFVNCKDLNSVTLPSTIRDIRTSAFMASGISKLPNLPEGIELNQATFMLCESLTFADMSDIELGAYCFDRCKSLECVVLPTFADFPTLMSNFHDCTSLKSIYLPVAVPTESDYDYFNEALFDVTLYVPEGSEELYRNAEGWNRFKNIKAGTYAGTETAEIANGTAVRVEGGRIIVESSDGATMPVEVYNTAGQKVRSLNAGGAAEIALPSGLYIVRAGTSVVKVAI